METQTCDHETPPPPLGLEAAARLWIAPLQTFKVFSIAEFTQNYIFPNSDGMTVIQSS